MENLFDYATKELSQDAFLRWLFESYQDEQIGFIAKNLIAEMVNLDGKHVILPEEITNVETHAQAENMDIVVDYKINGNARILIIEDKTSSNEHSNQLTTYKNIVENKWNKGKREGRPSSFVYYKTHRLDPSERNSVIDAGWAEFPFNKIKEFWEKYQKNKNIIISQYAKHVVKCWEDSNNAVRPLDNNIDKWVGYFEKTVIPNISIECDSWVGTTFYGYSYLQVRPKGKGNEALPYLEIRSRDCLNNKFEAKILLYGVDQKYCEPIRNIIRSRESNNIFKGDYGQKRNKQVAHTNRKNDKYKDVDDVKYIVFVNEAIEEYLSILSSI